MNYPKEINFRKYAVYIIAGWILWLYVFLVLLQNVVYESLVIEEGQTSFIATFDTVEAVVAANNDPAQEERLSEYPILLTIDILNGNGERVVCLEIDDSCVASGGFVSTDDFQMEGCPFSLTVGETYTVQYWAYANGDPVEGELALVLYGAESRPVGEALALGLLTAVLMAGLLLTERKHGNGPAQSDGGIPLLGYLLVYLTMSGILLISSPAMMENEEERDAFADAYAISNVILGEEAADEDGYVYIEESGLRLMGRMSDPQSLHRFWNNRTDGNVSGDGEISTMFRRSEVVISPVTYLDSAVIAAARLFGAPYQAIYLSGMLVNLTIGFVLMCIILRLLRQQCGGDEVIGRSSEPFRILIMAILLLPSMLHGAMSYSGSGVYAALGILLVLAAMQREGPHDKVCFAVIGISAVIAIAGAVRVLTAGGNVLMAAARSIVYNLNEWFFELVYIGAETAAGDEFVCLSILLLMAALCLLSRTTRRHSGENPASPVTTERGRQLRHLCIGTAAAGLLALTLGGTMEWLESGRLLLHGLPAVLAYPVMVVCVQMRQEPERRELRHRPSEDAEELTGSSDPGRLRYLWEILIMLCVYLGYLSVGGTLE